ncbi:SHOCT domain-containing protein [Synechococcus sp. CS-1328]|nr:SHOCT domain-containing protein [Synechococcus sp. CS-1328]
MAPMQMQPMSSMQPMSPMQPMSAMQQQPSWWPAELGVPASSGAQNELRYAIFPAAGRLAVEHSGHCRVFDVSGQAIRGVSLQSGTGDLILSTAEGDRPLSQFPEISPATEVAPERPAQITATTATATTSNATPVTTPTGGTDDPYAALERLGELKAKGILTEEEFSSKKAELLARL